ncbi:hypothetical protein NIES4071_99080 [Calothrix sp. NIES-4071]|nr:hypothetical protein NIES4071_99080 [Calothrix sp. NIES-4071]BAZ64171.1 hypothetical protein NIES4105_99010 [Calothrix sp. NIES-4105]
MSVNLFDVNYYRSVNANQRGLSDAEATSNFFSTGLNQGLKFSPLVDLPFYRSSNPELAGLTNQQLFDKLSNTGIAEGQKFSRVFDLKFYKDNNADLANLNNEQLFNHYISTGLREGRNASSYITSDEVSDRFKSASPINLGSTPITFRESVGDNDKGDMYRLQLDLPSTNLDLVLNGLSANANLELLDRKGNILSSSTNVGNSSESIDYSLNSGMYYIRVYQPVNGQNTNYNLTVSSKLLSNETSIPQTSASTPLPATPIATTPALPVVTNPFLDEVLKLVNIQRANANQGLQPLVLNDKLNQVAYSHSQEMALSDYFSHSGVNKSSPQDRAARAGYQYRYFGENIAAGYVTPQEVVDAWMTSAGHRANILNPNYKEMGVGYYYLESDTGSINYNYYWTQDFGTLA